MDFSVFGSLDSLTAHFTTDQICSDFLAEYRWGSSSFGVCPYCGRLHCGKSGGRYYCPKCNRKFSVKIGTIFEGTKLSLRKWFMAIYLISSNRKGISSCQLSKDLHITQKSAWFMLMKIRTLLVQQKSILKGSFECDEVYIGGKEKWKHIAKRTKGNFGRSTKTKTPVFGIYRRDGLINAYKTDITGQNIRDIIEGIADKGSKIFTDELNIYSCLNSEYIHEIIRHKSLIFSDGECTTNTVEGFWSHLRRMITGCYHKTTEKYLQRYVDEQVFRFNTRKMSEQTVIRKVICNSLGGSITHMSICI